MFRAPSPLPLCCAHQGMGGRRIRLGSLYSMTSASLMSVVEKHVLYLITVGRRTGLLHVVGRSHCMSLGSSCFQGLCPPELRDQHRNRLWGVSIGLVLQSG
jgi:hypothetical protein